MRLDWVRCCIVRGVLENNARERAQTSHIYSIIMSEWSFLRASQTNMRLGIVGSVGGALELGVGVDAIYYMCK